MSAGSMDPARLPQLERCHMFQVGRFTHGAGEGHVCWASWKPYAFRLQ